MAGVAAPLGSGPSDIQQPRGGFFSLRHFRTQRGEASRRTEAFTAPAPTYTITRRREAGRPTRIKFF
ncbi:hypothetical protein NDU88_002087 [Pleurodeles waltl]|uniref:Uncharacterized protein n=1 Tax=Pleurodeles waltl TaxID=8319 RepID=A0AAV7LJB0_PLEWA|nr:hypothetical protein NDU88_002087 [Pleurodeles waltl]